LLKFEALKKINKKRDPPVRITYLLHAIRDTADFHLTDVATTTTGHAADAPSATAADGAAAAAVAFPVV